MPKQIAIAIGAHPDDIEFHMAGTLLLLARAGWEIHYMNLASGNCGSARMNGIRTRKVRALEAREAARILGAQFHPSLTDDLEITYAVPLVRKVAAVIRDVQPAVVLTHSPQDYMEDHTCTARLAVTAAFARGMPNFKTVPARPAKDVPVVIYHCMPHGLRDPLGKPVVPGAFVNTSSVHATKQQALACHKSQQPWLESSQGFNSYVAAMDGMSRELGQTSRRFRYAEGWRRHFHLGFAAPDSDPLREALGRRYLLNPAY